MTSEQDIWTDTEYFLKMHRLFVKDNGLTHFGKAFFSKKMSSIVSRFSDVICPLIKSAYSSRVLFCFMLVLKITVHTDDVFCFQIYLGVFNSSLPSIAAHIFFIYWHSNC